MQPEGAQVDGLILARDGRFEIRKQGGARFRRPRLSLLQCFLGQLDASAAFGRERDFNGLLEAELEHGRPVL